MKLYYSERHNFLVVFDPDKCIHCGRCLAGLPAVFERGVDDCGG